MISPALLQFRVIERRVVVVLQHCALPFQATALQGRQRVNYESTAEYAVHD